jgi:hypothetical protein
MDDRTMAMFEKSTQNYFKEAWEYIWSLVGSIGVFILVGAGIYFSQVAFAYWLGKSELMIAVSYGLSVAISALETAGIKLLGNKVRSSDIKYANALEHRVMLIFTAALFFFDILSNIFGVYVTIEANLGKVTFVGWLIVLGMSTLMGGSELMVGWMLRSLAVSYTGFISAKKLFDKFQAQLDKENAIGNDGRTGNNGRDQAPYGMK